MRTTMESLELGYLQSDEKLSLELLKLSFFNVYSVAHPSLKFKCSSQVYQLPRCVISKQFILTHLVFFETSAISY